MNSWRVADPCLHAGGIPFDRAVTRKDGQWVSDENASRELREKLGMHRYVPAFPFEGAQGLRQTFDPLLVGLAPGADNLPQASVNITTTLPLHVADPALFGLYSVTYLSKPVCRHTHIAGQLEDPSGEADTLFPAAHQDLAKSLRRAPR